MDTTDTDLFCPVNRSLLYDEIVDSFSLSKQKKYCENKSYRVFVSVIVDEVRLIDNILLN